MFIIAQIAAFIAIALIIYSSFRKVGRQALLIFNIITNILNATHYLLLDAYSGAVCSVIFTIMLAVFYFKGKTKFLSSIALPILFGAAFIGFGLLTYQNWISVIPIVGHCLLVIAFWMDEEIVIKEFCVVVAAMWTVYNGLIWSPVNFIGQLFCFFSYSSFVIRYFRNKKRTEKELPPENEE